MSTVFIGRDTNASSPRFGKVNGIYRCPQYAQAFESTITSTEEPITVDQAVDLAAVGVAASDFDLRARDVTVKPTPITEQVADAHPDVLEYQAYLVALNQAAARRATAINAAIDKLVAA